MTNIINTPSSPTQSPEMWQYPVGIDNTADDIAELQQGRYADYLATPDPESQAVEQGLPTAPIREGAVNNLEAIPSADQFPAYETRDGRPIDQQSAEAVLTTAAQGVNEAYAALPEAQQARLRQEHLQAANARAGVYGPMIVTMRHGAYDAQFLTKKDLDLGA